jgi:hypothetical protein
MLAILPSQSSASSVCSSKTRLRAKERGSRTEFRERMRQKSFLGVEPCEAN